MKTLASCTCFVFIILILIQIFNVQSQNIESSLVPKGIINNNTLIFESPKSKFRKVKRSTWAVEDAVYSLRDAFAELKSTIESGNEKIQKNNEQHSRLSNNIIILLKKTNTLQNDMEDIKKKINIQISMWPTEKLKLLEVPQVPNSTVIAAEFDFKGSVLITAPPKNVTKVEGEMAIFTCDWCRSPVSNASVTWLRDGTPVSQIRTLDTRVETPSDGRLIINPVNAEDSGFYECQVSHGMGDPQTAIAYLNVEYPAKVTHTPMAQYLPNHMAGIVKCYVVANPPAQFVMWTKDEELLEPYETVGFDIMYNGSLFIESVKDSHQGMYTCTPYNVHGTQGSSLQMAVIVKEPPKFEVTPDPVYQSQLGSSLEIPCSAVSPNGTNPLITWQRVFEDMKDGKLMPVNVVNGSLIIKNLHPMDHGEYECVASNEAATLITGTKIIVEGTRPLAPFNITATSSMFSVTLIWSPGYSGGPNFIQNYVIRHRLLGESRWGTLNVTPEGGTLIVIRNLLMGTSYQFVVIGINDLGEGHPSQTINITTKGALNIQLKSK